MISDKNSFLTISIFTICFLATGCTQLPEIQLPFFKDKYEYIKDEASLKVASKPEVKKAIVTQLSNSLQENDLEVLPLTAIYDVTVTNSEITSLEVAQDSHVAYAGTQDGRVFRIEVKNNTSKNFLVTELLVPKLTKPQKTELNASKSASADNTATNAPVAAEVDRSLDKQPEILSLALSKSEKLLAIGQFSEILIYNFEEQRFVNRLSRAKGKITSLAWDYEDKLLVIGQETGEIYVWNLEEGMNPGQDSLNALEYYQGATSPIQTIAVHPSSRSFFVLEQNGGVLLWNLLKSDRQSGVVDSESLRDLGKKGVAKIEVARIGARGEDLWLSPDGQMLFVAAAPEATLYTWKTRGLVEQIRQIRPRETHFSLLGTEANGKPLIFSYTRSQRVAVWCQYPLSKNFLEKNPGYSAGFSPVALSSTLPTGGKIFRTSKENIRTSKQNLPSLWLSQKKGSIYFISLEEALRSSQFADKINQCFNRSN